MLRKKNQYASKVKIIIRVGMAHRADIGIIKEEYVYFEGDTTVSKNHYRFEDDE